MIRVKTSSKITTLSIPNKDPKYSDKLLYSRRTGQLIRLSNHYVRLLHQNDFVSMPEALIELLLKSEMIVPADENESDTLKLKEFAYKVENEPYLLDDYNQISDLEIIRSAKKLRLISD